MYKGVCVCRYPPPFPDEGLRYSVNSLYNKCEILKFGDSIKLSNFIYAHDNIKGNLPTTLCAGITLLDSKH